MSNINITITIPFSEFRDALIASFNDSLGYNQGGAWSNEAKRSLVTDILENMETQQELFVFCTDYLDMNLSEFFLREYKNFRGVQAKTEW